MVRREISDVGRIDRNLGARRRVPMRDRRRGALRRHGPLWRRTDPAFVEFCGVPQLGRSTTRDRRRSSSTARPPKVTSSKPLSGAAAHPAHRARHRRHRHRQPVDHHRGLLDDPAGDPARLAAAPDHQTDLCRGLRPDLRRRRQLVADDRHAGAHHRLRQIRQPRGGLWHRRVGDDADDQRAAVHRDARDLEMEHLRRRAGRFGVHDRRRRLSRRQPGQGARRRLRAAAARHRSSTA